MSKNKITLDPFQSWAHRWGRIGTLIALVYMIGVLGTYTQQRMMLVVSRSAIEKIRNDLYEKIQKLPVRFYDNESTGEIMSRFTNDVDNIGLMLDQSLMSMFSGIINLVGNVILFILPGWLLPAIWKQQRNFFRFFF